MGLARTFNRTLFHNPEYLSAQAESWSSLWFSPASRRFWSSVADPLAHTQLRCLLGVRSMIISADDSDI